MESPYSIDFIEMVPVVAAQQTFASLAPFARRIERAARLASNGKLSNEKAVKLIRETSTAIEEAHGKLQANGAEKVLKASLEEFVRMAGGELTTYTDPHCGSRNAQRFW